MQLHGELDRLARRACGRDDDDAARRWLGRRKCVTIRRKVVIADVTQCRSVIPGDAAKTTNVEGAPACPNAGAREERLAPACAEAEREAGDWRRASPAPLVGAEPPHAGAPGHHAPVLRAAVARHDPAPRATVRSETRNSTAAAARACSFARCPWHRCRTRRARSAGACEWRWRNPLARAGAPAARHRSRCGTFPEADDGSPVRCSLMIAHAASPRTLRGWRPEVRNASWSSQCRVAHSPKAGEMPRAPGRA